MTSGVGLTGTTSNAAIQKVQISSSTKRQLEALGIDASSVTSESQAQSLIAAKQAEKSFQDTMSMSIENKAEQSSASSEDSLVLEVTSLAQELGINVSSDATFDEIAAQINEAIQKMMDNAVNNPYVLQQAQSYMTRLSQLNSYYSNATSPNTGMYDALNYQAANTKYMLGL
ncbi:MAG: hypothetical protein NC200_00700 [Candidatus Gastranaerophilales bacterium]|nr:hypothetical protein [Candidatus Gastranaerophilales bacterium]